MLPTCSWEFDSPYPLQQGVKLEKIFIQTASFNEKEIYNTVRRAYEKAEFPDRIYFGLYDQRLNNSFEDFSNIENVTHVKVICSFARGIGLARLNSMMLHQKEKYCLQIDAHTIFDKNWDSKLISDYEKLKNITDKPIISYRTKFWERDSTGTIVYYSSGNHQPLVINEQDPHFYMKTHDTLGSYPFEHYLSSGHFVFTELEFFNDFMPDPKIAFAGEEHSLALRACTRGYRIFVTKDPHLWHMSKNDQDRYIDPDSWNAHTRFKRNFDLDFNTLLSDKSTRIGKILRGEILGYYGAPDIESYNAYINKLGFDYRTGKKIKGLE